MNGRTSSLADAEGRGPALLIDGGPAPPVPLYCIGGLPNRFHGTLALKERAFLFKYERAPIGTRTHIYRHSKYTLASHQRMANKKVQAPSTLLRPVRLQRGGEKKVLYLQLSQLFSRLAWHLHRLHRRRLFVCFSVFTGPPAVDRPLSEESRVSRLDSESQGLPVVGRPADTKRRFCLRLRMEMDVRQRVAEGRVVIYHFALPDTAEVRSTRFLLLLRDG